VNWGFAIEVAAWVGSLAGLAIWMLTSSLTGRPERPRSDSEQQ
jgi:hypothetical protein